MAKQSLTGKLVSQTEIKIDGDLFHTILKDRPHQISSMSPSHIQSCALHDGQWGKVGSLIVWNYTHGKYLIRVYIINLITVFQ